MGLGGGGAERRADEDGDGRGRTRRGFRKVRVAPREGAGIVDNVVIKRERDVVNGKVDRSVIVREKVDFASITVVVVVGAIIGVITRAVA